MESRADRIRILVAPALVGFVLLAGCSGRSDPPAGKTAANDPQAAVSAASQSPVERGRYLVTSMGCSDCHTPWKMGANGPEPDMTRLLSGHPRDLAVPAVEVRPPWLFMGNMTMTAFAGPWGVSYAANLTSDEETGIGAWDDNTFVNAIRNGKMQGGGRPILPPMPWTWMKNLTDDDLKAMSAYLHTVPASQNKVPEATPPGGKAR